MLLLNTLLRFLLPGGICIGVCRSLLSLFPIHFLVDHRQKLIRGLVQLWIVYCMTDAQGQAERLAAALIELVKVLADSIDQVLQGFFGTIPCQYQKLIAAVPGQKILVAQCLAQ